MTTMPALVLPRRPGVTLALSLLVGACAGGTTSTTRDASPPDASTRDGSLHDASAAHDAIASKDARIDASGGSDARRGDAEASAALAPQVFWASEPVGPDETVLLTTGRTDPTSAVRVAQLGNAAMTSPFDVNSAPLAWQSVVPLQASTSSMKFVVPEAFTTGVYAYEVTSGGVSSATGYLDRPNVWFVEGDYGGYATPGGWLQLHGTAISLDPATPSSIALCQGQTVVATIAGTNDPNGNRFRQRFALPATIPAGAYTLYAHNGFGGSAGWSQFAGFDTAPVTTVTVAAAPAWPSTVVNVTLAAGSTADARFASAIATLTTNGGGVLYAPQGTYSLSKGLVLPEHTILRGDGKDITTLSFTMPSATAEDTLVTGATLTQTPLTRATFSLESLTLSATSAYSAIGIDRRYTTEAGWFTNVHVVLPAIGNYCTAVGGTAMFLRQVASTLVDGCELDATNAFFSRDGVSHVRVATSTLDWRAMSYTLSSASHGFVFENDTINLRGDATSNDYACPSPNPGAWITSFYATLEDGPFTKDVYVGGNTSTRDELTSLPDPSVGFTLDGGNAIYLGRVVSVSGTTLTLEGHTTDPAEAGASASNGSLTYNWAGAIAMIVDGTGLGQWRTLTNAPNDSSTVTIDRAWDIDPDSTSTLELINLQGRLLFVNNQFAQERTNQEYFGALDIIKANNTYSIAGNFVWIGSHYSEQTPSWHFQYLDNVITSGGSLGSSVQSVQPGYAGVLAGSQVYRDNTDRDASAAAINLRVNPKIEAGTFNDSVVEKNAVGSITLGRSGDTLRYDGVVLRKNVASYDAGALAGKGAANVPGVTLVP